MHAQKKIPVCAVLPDGMDPVVGPVLYGTAIYVIIYMAGSIAQFGHACNFGDILQGSYSYTWIPFVNWKSFKHQISPRISQ